MISLIYARSQNHCIGRNGQLPWNLPDDFAHFEKMTMGYPIIMGRKTYEDHKSLLQGRRNIVISAQVGYKTVEGVELARSLNEAITLARTESEQVFIIGGVSFFTAALPVADCVFETVVAAKITGDTILPSFDFSDWDTVLLQDHPADARHEFAFKIYRHQRRQSSQGINLENTR
ncbi:MAG: dihydrofolate reductase [Halioglobus sp.]